MSRPGGRQEPRQARSREMVDRILLAAAQVLAERGYGGLSTNRVAEVAGVSVGSLYRYFQDKDDLVEHLRERSTADVLEALGAGMAEAVALPTRDAVRHVVATLVAGLQRHRAVISALINEVPLGSHGNVLPDLERQLAHVTRMFVASHAPGLEPAEAEARIYLAMGITLTTSLRIALEPPPGITEDRLVDLTAELLEVGLLLP
ncbi:TetR/AcrR family transcriptional regulator [Nocardioides pantholopis]|uniref:TetR/AcrR family transcriptional regulator n=1 Tax=Nocardioides pantholopis TaxID=2483798 RepID=UPI000FDAF667|nr:TetR/AcrR family transcriptional regulator [Nocardioides pantholopis]